MFWGIVRPFLPSKMASRLRLFGHNYAALHKCVACVRAGGRSEQTSMCRRVHVCLGSVEAQSLNSPCPRRSRRLVPREVLPPAFGGTATTGFDDFLDRMEAKEKEVRVTAHTRRVVTR